VPATKQNNTSESKLNAKRWTI